MKITSLLSKLILESSRFQVLYDKMVKPSGKTEDGKPGKGLISFSALKDIILADPTSKAPDGFDIETATPEDMEQVKVGKYTQWLIKNFVTPKENDFEFEGERDSKNPQFKKAKQEFQRLFLEDLFKQTERLQFYERVKQYLPQEQRDINKLGIKDLFNIFANFQLPEKKRKEEEKKMARKTREGFKHAGGQIIFEGSKWVLIKISDTGTVGKDAAIYYGGFKDHRGGESDWCTSAPGLNYFNGYIKDGPLYVVFPQDDKGEVGSRTGLPKERYQFHFPSSQFMDRDDHQIDLVNFLNGDGSELKEIFKPEFAKGLTEQNGSKVNIVYPQGSAGKFIALYGYEELFNNLPESVEGILVKNSTNAQFSHPIPESIGRLKNLSSIMMQNCVSSVPSSLGNCKKLSFISLPDNKELKTVPESLKDLPNLQFINLKGCSSELLDGSGIPESFKKMLLDAGDSEKKEKGFFFVVGE